MTNKNIWSKGKTVNDWMIRFTVGEDWRWDTILLPYDLKGTRGHAIGLAQIGVLTEAELVDIHVALDELDAIAETLNVLPEDEDCHTVIERLLIQKLGDLGKKIHTGRSRNDQVLTALRLYLKDALHQVMEETHTLIQAFVAIGAENAEVLMPGYTHYQRAMPSSIGLWAMGYAEVLTTDLRILKGAYEVVNVSPLGSAAGYGVPFLTLPRRDVATTLGFAEVQLHVTSVQLSRGKMEMNVVQALAQVGASINRAAADLVLMNSSEFNAVKLPPEYCTGSSIMPQKQNPDILEIARASYHRLVAELQLLLSLPANLPSGYHRDLQLTKEAVMRAMRVAQDMLIALNLIVPKLSFNRDFLAAQLSPDLFATADALERVSNGVPFRDAYRMAAENVPNLRTPEHSEILHAYRTPGTLGNLQGPWILEQAQAVMEQINR
ncbi:MAG TPA: argininosuccinate lyase [Rhodothermales bacterium]|nr:argininosuccinate lyase [Rhodothermales bacterium]